MDEAALTKYFTSAYEAARAQRPNVSRRQLKQQVVSHFWRLSKTEKVAVVQEASVMPVLSFEPGPGLHDIQGLTDSRAIGTRGVVVRTHFEPEDEVAWKTFLGLLENLERRSLSSIADAHMDEDSETENENEGDSTGEEACGTDPENSQDTEMTGGDRPPGVPSYEHDAIFVVIDPTEQLIGEASKQVLSGASNLALLRLFNDISIAPSPPLPDSAPKRIKPGHRLVDEDGYQEVYAGPRLWVWDQQSAKDQTLRLVSSRVFTYGDATGDSWRAKATHMWDLQVNMDAGMRIDFSGGVGIGWDMAERNRNMKEPLV